MVVYGLVAYKRTGKDTFVKCLREGLKQNWVVWSLTGQPLHISQDVVRVSFADRLRKQTVDYINHPDLNLDTLESQKDTKEYTAKNIFTGETETKILRDWIIHIASYYRLLDPCYYVDIVKKQLQFTINDVCITDVRFPEEVSVCDKTIRLFRKDVPIPDKSIVSEHALDNLDTDYLLLLEGEESYAMEAGIRLNKYKRVKRHYV